MLVFIARSRGVLVAFAAAAALYALSWHLGEGLREVRARQPPVEERVFLPNPESARIAAAGYSELAADVVWARTLVYYGDGMMHGFTMQDVVPLVELVNALDPYFRRPYLWGGAATVFRQPQTSQEDYRASVAILERGLKVYPHDWEMAWTLGLRYFSDLKSDDAREQRELQEIGASYIERAMRQPNAPPDLPNLAAALRSQLGQHERALRELREMILTMEDGKARDKLIERYQQLSSASQAAALRSASEGFVAAWKRDLPFAPAELYVLVGAPPPPRSPEELLETPAFLGAGAEDLGAAVDEPQDEGEEVAPDATPPDSGPAPARP